MQNFFYILLSLLFTSSFALNAIGQTASDSIVLTHAAPELTNVVQKTSTEMPGGSAVLYSADELYRLKGNRIEAIYVGVKDYTNVNDLKIYVCESLSNLGDPVCTSLPTKEGWNRFLLERPVTIDGNPLYIAYTITGNSDLYYTKATANGSESSALAMEDGSIFWMNYRGSDAAAVAAIVKRENAASNEVSIVHSRLTPFAKYGEPLSVGGTIRNNGTQPVTSLLLEIQCGDQRFEREVKNLNIAPGEEGDFLTEIPGYEEDVTATFGYTITEVNGETETTPDDNKAINITLHVNNLTPERKSLLEVFTGEWCAYCPKAAANVITMMEERPGKLVTLYFHDRDSFEPEETKDLLWFHCLVPAYFPACMIDRRNETGKINDTPHDDGSPMAHMSWFPPVPQLAEYRLAQPAAAFLNLKTELNETTRELNVYVLGCPLLDFPTETARLSVFIREDNVEAINQKGSSFPYYHRYVARQSLTGSWGEPIHESGVINRKFAFSVPEEYDLKNLSVVAYLSNYDSGNRLNCEVYQAAESGMNEGEGGIGTAIENAHTDDNVFFNGETITFTTAVKTAELYDSFGRLLSVSQNATSVSLANRPAGVYLIQLTDASGKTVGKKVVRSGR